MEDQDERNNSNMLFTLHVYQYMIDKVGTGESKILILIFESEQTSIGWLIRK